MEERLDVYIASKYDISRTKAKKLIDEDKVLVKYPQGVKSVTPGQACVFYNGEECLGGGIIREVRKNNEKLWYL